MKIQIIDGRIGTESHWSDVLNVQSDIASDDEIRAAYRHARRDAHPDAGGTSEQFNAVQDAWEQAKQERDL